MTPSTPDKLNEELQEKLKLVLTEFYGEHYCGRCEDYHGLMEEDEEDLGRTISAITTAYAEAIKKSRPEKQNKYSHYSTWGDGYDTGVRDFIEDLTAQGLLPNGKDE